MSTNPLPLPSLSKTYTDKFWSYVDVSTPEECWNWKHKSHFINGYGAFSVEISKRNWKNFKAHRVAYFLHYGINPNDKNVCHTCDNPSCCNPRHLFLGTNFDNVQDRNKKHRQSCGEKHSIAIKNRNFIPYLKLHPEKAPRGRNHWMKKYPQKAHQHAIKIGKIGNHQGINNGNAKLTEKEVKSIRSMYETGNYNRKKLANIFQISALTIWEIVNYKKWTHI